MDVLTNGRYKHNAEAEEHRDAVAYPGDMSKENKRAHLISSPQDTIIVFVVTFTNELLWTQRGIGLLLSGYAVLSLRPLLKVWMLSH